jgi:hypothetical protein
MKTQLDYITEGSRLAMSFIDGNKEYVVRTLLDVSSEGLVRTEALAILACMAIELPADHLDKLSDLLNNAAAEYDPKMSRFLSRNV